MLIPYITNSGNRSEIDCLEIPSYLEKIDGVYFEKREEIKEVKKVEITEIQEIETDLEDRAKEYLREQKVKWFWLLKWDKLVERAVKEGFII